MKITINVSELSTETVERIINETTDSNVLSELAKHKDWYIRQNVAWNKNTPISILYELAKDKNKHVRAAVVDNERTPHELHLELSKDKDENVRAEVAYVTKDPELLETLRNDKSKLVRSEAQR